MACGFCGADNEEFMLPHCCEAMMSGGVELRMPDQDSDARVTAELQELAAAVDRVVDGRNPNRGASLEVARRYRALHASLPDHTALKAVVGLAMVTAAEKVTRAQGTAAWDEPETIDEAKARMGTLPAAPGPGVLDRVNERGAAPMEDDALEFWAALGSENAARSGPTRHLGQGVVELVAEIRRLRSDEWLARATEEIARDPNCCDIQSSSSGAMEDILRKHRDGKA